MIDDPLMEPLKYKVHRGCLSGMRFYDRGPEITNAFGKSKARRRVSNEKNANWKKQNISFDLLYWKDLLSRHNLDVMHVERNVCDIVLEFYST